MPLDTRISLYKLQVFCHVVELGGVGRAADHLYVAQPVVSAHLRSLQQRLGVKLLVRQGRQMELTEAGAAIYAWAKDTLTRGNEVMREVDGFVDGTAGVALVAASMSLGSYLLPPILANFRRERPAANVGLEVTDPQHALDAVQAGACDFAVVLSEDQPEPQYLTSIELGHEHLLLIAALDGPPESDYITPAQLTKIPLVASPRSHGRRSLIDKVLARSGLSTGPASIELGHPEAMKRAVGEGLGVSLLFQSAVEQELENGMLRRITIDAPPMLVPVFLTHRHDKRLSPLQRDLVDFVAAGVRERLSTRGMAAYSS
ncbi:MAG TPA: LysR family transcriptional regulator [Solirubrobacteraceae bacterium]|nr:LysR family transcriptional regulator [Solirubrobacteraceae bacterium]